jgi:potassium efflux system protein
MRLLATNVFVTALLVALCLIPGRLLAQEQPQGEGPLAAQKESAEALPDLDKVIPLSAELSGRLAVLESMIVHMPDFSVVERQYITIGTRLKGPADQLQKFGERRDYRYANLVDIKRQLEREQELFTRISPPVNKAIHQLGTWRKEWLAEKERWNRWQSAMPEERQLKQINSAFAKANLTIDGALELIRPKLEELLAIQEAGGAVQGRIKSLLADVDGLLMLRKQSIMLAYSPPMVSPRYFSQFGSELWSAAQNGIDEITWPDRSFFERLWWTFSLQAFFFLAVTITLYRNRRQLLLSKRWSFLAARPLAAGIFSCYMATVLLYEYQGVPATWKLANSIIAGISFVRLAGSLIEESWKRQFLYGVVTVFIVNRSIFVANVPLPLVRLYSVGAALAGLFLCLQWARESGRHRESRLYARSLRLASFYLAVTIVAQLWGKKVLALYLFSSLTDSLATILVFMLFTYLLHGGLEWLFRASPLQRGSVLNTADSDVIIRPLRRFIDAAVWVLLLFPALLRIWGAYDSLEAATKSLLAFGVSVGAQRITVGLVILAAGILYGSFFISWLFQKVLVDKVLVRRQAERGVRLAVGRLVHYAFVFAGFLLAISILGVEITKVTIMLSALGVGIGFGLQGVVNNFVSGLILLFERPVRVGDFIEFGGNWSEVRSIGLRSTTVQTFDSSDVIIPNADLISNRVTNWTLSNRRRRIDIPVGVAYGSDVPLVIKTLVACATGNAMLAETPEPQVLFLRFGESSLEFELRVFVFDVKNSMNAISELHQEINRRFQEAKIEIAFPQRDLHLRSLDESVMARPPATDTRQT